VESGNRNQRSSLAVSWKNTCLTQVGKSKKENQKKRKEHPYCTWVTGIVVAKRSDQKKLMHADWLGWAIWKHWCWVNLFYAHQEKVRLRAHFVEVST
jgi:hypothetical protein